MTRWISAGCLALALTATPAAVEAQCLGPSSASFTRYGRTCPFFGTVFLGGSYDATRCALTFDLTAPPPLGGTSLVGQLLLLGTGKIDPAVPHRALASGCRLSVSLTSPYVLVPFPRGVNLITLRVPQALTGATVYTQGIDHFFTTTGQRNDLQSSQGLQVDFR